MWSLEIMLKYLPAQCYFDRETEKKFQLKLNESSRRLLSMAFHLTFALLLSLNILSIISDGIDSNIDVNIIRCFMMVLSILIIYLCKKEHAENLEQRFFIYVMIFYALSGYLFWVITQEHQQLNEGGPMLVAAMIVAVPVLHLGHKLVLWAIIGISLIAIQLFTPFNIFWSIYFFLATLLVMGCVQYQLDILLRTQFRSQLIEAEKAKTDQLTGVHNRYSFDHTFTKLLNNLTNDKALSIALIDIDYFKKYNDSYGHLEGDRVLVTVAQILSDLNADLVVRFGGEEFILIKVHAKDDTQCFHDLPALFANKKIPHKLSPFKYITVSAGIVTTADMTPPYSSTQLLKAADQAMYQAKNAGRNQIFVTSINKN